MNYSRTVDEFQNYYVKLKKKLDAKDDILWDNVSIKFKDRMKPSTAPYWFLIAAVRCYQKLKQHEFLLSQFWSLEGLTWVSRGQHRGVYRAAPPGGSRGESIRCLFQLPEAPTFLGSWPLPPSSRPTITSQVLLKSPLPLCLPFHF